MIDTSKYMFTCKHCNTDATTEDVQVLEMNMKSGKKNIIKVRCAKCNVSSLFIERGINAEKT